jgi:uncharacterized protein YrrD
MLRRVKDLQRYAIAARDGDLGRIDDVYFDDQSWTVRDLVVNTGSWLTGRLVLIPPGAIQGVDGTTERILTNLTKKQVEDSPGADSAKPVSRQYERDVYRYYGYPFYWGGPYLWGPIIYPTEPPPPTSYELERRGGEEPTPDINLRSARDVTGHKIQATDGQLGHVEDFVIDEQSWAIRYLLVDPRSWWPGHWVLISTDWITAVHWKDLTVEVDVDKEAVRQAPVYEPERLLDRDYESRLHEHFRRHGYWERRPEDWKRYPPAA